MVNPTQPFSDPAAAQTKAQAPASVPSAGLWLNVYNLTAFNPHATDVAYLQLFDLPSASVTVGTTVATKVIPLPPKGGVDGARSAPMTFTSGRCTYAVTATATGAGALSAACVFGFDYNY